MTYAIPVNSQTAKWLSSQHRREHAAIAAVGIVCTVAAFALERWAKRRGIQL